MSWLAYHEDPSKCGPCGEGQAFGTGPCDRHLVPILEAENKRLRSVLRRILDASRQTWTPNGFRECVRGLANEGLAVLEQGEGRGR